MTPAGKLVRVADLIGKDIKGCHAMTVQPVHRHLFTSGLPIYEMIRAERKIKDDGAWLYLHYIGGCGYTGWKESSYGDVAIEMLD